MKGILIIIVLLTICLHLTAEVQLKQMKKLMGDIEEDISLSEYQQKHSKITQFGFSINIGRTEKGQEYEHGTLIAKTKNDDVICYEILTTDNNSYLLNVFDDKRCINKLQHKNIYFDVESKIVHDDMIKLFYKFAREESLSYKFKSVKKINTIE